MKLESWKLCVKKKCLVNKGNKEGLRIGVIQEGWVCWSTGGRKSLKGAKVNDVFTIFRKLYKHPNGKR